MMYNPDGWQWMNLWVSVNGTWCLNRVLSARSREWHAIRIQVSDIMSNDELVQLITTEVNRAPRVDDKIDFARWRWWQDAVTDTKEEE